MQPSRSTARRRWGSRACLLVTVCTSAVTAQPAARFDLTWSGPPGCPPVENVQARVDALLGGGRSPSSFADVRASGQVERVDSGFRLLLTMGVGSTPSSRVIEARTCDELAGAAAIAIALLARSTMESAPEADSPTSTNDGAAGSPASSGDEAKAPPSPPPKPAAAPSNQQDSPAKASPGRLRLVLDAPVGVAGWGSLPATGLGIGAGVGIRWRALRVTARGELWQPQTEQVSGFASRFTLHSGRTEACLVSDMHGFELGPCLGAAVQRMSGEGVGSEIFSARSKTSLWFAGVGGIFASVPTPGFAHLRFFGGASVLVSPSRPRFVIDQLGPVNEPALAAPQVDLGCEWIF